MAAVTQQRNVLMQAAEDMKVEGYAILWNTPTILYTENGINYYEFIEPTAINNKTHTKECSLKYNHSDEVMILATVRNGSLTLIKDKKGLKIKATLAGTTAGRDFYTLVRDGFISQMSFAFIVAAGGADYDKPTRTRIITDIARLVDVSGVDLAQYDGTSLKVVTDAEARQDAQRRRRLKLKLSMELDDMKQLRP